MSNSIIKAQDGDEERVQSWVHIDDFSPGIYNGSFISGSDPSISAPLGAAKADNTYACASIISGPLGPLPARTQANSIPFPFPGATTILYETGFAANLGLDDGTTELIIMLEGDDGTDHYYLVYSVIAETGSAVPIVDTTNPTTGVGIFGASFPTWTRISTQPVEGVSGYVLPSPSLVWPGAVSTDANGDRGHVYIYPDPTDPTAFQAFDMVSPTPGDSAVAGALFAFGNRIVVFQPEGSDWPVGGGELTNENIGVTDPPQGDVYPAEFDSNPDIPNTTILSAESPWGYAAWGSASVGELLLIKKNGGAVVVNGDLLAPTSVIPLPAVESVGGDGLGLACSTAMGVVYCAQDKGAWLWNGGNTSQKLSPQLDDNFFNAGATGGTVPNNNLAFLVERWQDWIVFSNNFLYNPDSGSWWILYPNQSQTAPGLDPITFFWWKQGRQGNVVWCGPIVNNSASAAQNLYYNKFDSTVASSHWSWQSVPFHLVPTDDRVVDVRQIILRLSAPDGTSPTATVLVNGTEIGTTGGAIGTEPTTFRFNVGQTGLSDFDVTVRGDNSVDGDSAPILHSIDIGYNIAASIGADN